MKLVDGVRWEQNADTWVTVINDRFYCLTWKFGTIHQAKVVIKYQFGGHESTLFEGRSSSVGLQPGKTQVEAMRRTVEWVRDYQKNGSPKAPVVIDRALKYYRDIFPDRAEVLDHIFFSGGGNGYDWFDGSILNHTQDDDLDERMLQDTLKTHDQYENWEETIAEIIKVLPAKDTKDIRKKLKEQNKKEQKEEQERLNRAFELRPDSLIHRIPPDLRKDWKIVVIEAFELLIRRGDEAAQKFAKKNIKQFKS